MFVAVDTGGTFTDLVALDPDTGLLSYTKSLTTHDRPITGILRCIEKASITLRDAAVFKHGTTLVINTLLERSGPLVGLVTTAGFRDLIDLGRGSRTEPFNLSFRRLPPLVSPAHRFELAERMLADGTPQISPSLEAVQALAQRISLSGVAAVAISFLNAYLNPEHERRVAELLRELLPELYVSCGSDLTREWHEFERTMTVVANAYAGPKAGRHFASLVEVLGSRGFDGELLLMSSSGGVLSAEKAATAPVLLVESGPVGGCIGAAVFARHLGLAKVVAFDMGGTTAKCSLVEDGEFDLDSTYYIGGYAKGMPILAPVLDIVEVGAGGGSIAWIDPQGGFHVGPQSAGSSPGPIAYGLGGKEPTVTDANLILNRINSDNFQGGELKLDMAGATAALTAMAGQLGYDSAERVASGILAIANVTMGGAIKKVTVERGKDPRDFVMFAYGGGPLHGADLARSLGIPTVIIPPEPSNFSAIGMLLADLRLDASRTFVRELADEAIAAMDRVFSDIEADLRRDQQGKFDTAQLRFDRRAELRFVGQSHAVEIGLSGLASLTDIRGRFCQAYQGRYGHVDEHARLEFIALHCVATAATAKPDLSQLARPRSGEAVAHAERTVYFPELSISSPSPVFHRSSLPHGWSANGPAIIEEYGSTTVVGPLDNYEVGMLGEIVIHVSRRQLKELC